MTTMQVDSQGRTVKQTDPNGNVTYTVYDDAHHATRTYRGWNAATHQPTTPVEVYRDDLAGNYTEAVTYTWNDSAGLPVDSLGRPTGAESLTDSRAVIQSLCRSLMNNAGQVVQSMKYTSLPISTALPNGYSAARSLGQKGVNYLETDSFYDSMGRQAGVTDSSGTVHDTFYDAQGNVVSEWTGTSDVPTTDLNGDSALDPRDFFDWVAAHPTAVSMTASGITMYMVSSSTYDSVGNVRSTTQYPDAVAAHNRTTLYGYDGRDRQVYTINPPDAQGQVTYTMTTYDNRGEQIQVAQYEYLGSQDPQDLQDALQAARLQTTPAPLTYYDKLLGLQATAYDDQGRVYCKSTYSVDITQSPSVVGTTPISSNTWYDSRGNVVASQSAGQTALTKTMYDGAGRTTDVYVGHNPSAQPGDLPTYAEAGNVANDVILEQSHTDYDPAGNAIEMTTYDRHAAATGTGPLTTATARVTQTGAWYDAAGRETATADYGTGSFNRNTQTSPPTSSDAVHVDLTQYDDAGNPYRTIDAAGHVTQSTYDLAGRVTKIVQNLTGSGIYDPAYSDQNVTTTFQYTPDDQLWKETDTLGNTTEYLYDARERLNQKIDPDPDGSGPETSPVTAYAYDNLDEVTAVMNPLGQTTFYQHDKLGRQILITPPDPDGSGPQTAPSTATVYDLRGNVYSQTDAFGHTTTYVFDAWNRLQTESDPDGNATTYTYYDSGLEHTITDPDGNTTTYAYDPLGCELTETNQLGYTRSYTNDGGSLSRVVDRDGRVKEYAYDSFARPIDEYWYADVSAADADTGRTAAQKTIQTAYDRLGNVTSAGDSNATYTYASDALGRDTSIVQSIAALSSVTFSQSFNGNGNRTQLIATIGTTIDFANNYQFDNLGRMTQVTQSGLTGGNGAAEKRVDLVYRADGQFDTISRYADLAGSNLVASGHYGYDYTGRLTSLTYTLANSTTAPAYVWTWDAGNRITGMYSRSDTASTSNLADYTTWAHAQYNYDPAGQLATTITDGVTTLAATYANWQNSPSATGEDYQYDANGNQVNDGYTVSADGNNQMATDSRYSYQYDPEGNRIARWINNNGGTESRPQPDDTEITIYQWDNRNRLTEVDSYSDYVSYSAQTPLQTVEYSYDFANRWLGETVTTYSGGVGTVVQQREFVYDGNQIVMTFNGSGSLTNRDLWGPQVDQLLAQENVSGLTAGTTLWALTDNLSTIRDLATYNVGTQTASVAEHRVFDDFGVEISPSVSAVDCIFGYTGKPSDAATGLQNNLNRWYEAVTHRWLSEDPIQADICTYRYVGNDPIRFCDPAGEVRTPTQLVEHKVGLLTREVEKYEGSFGLSLADGGHGAVTSVQFGVGGNVDDTSLTYVAKTTVVGWVTEPPKGMYSDVKIVAPVRAKVTLNCVMKGKKREIHIASFEVKKQKVTLQPGPVKNYKIDPPKMNTSDSRYDKTGGDNTEGHYGTRTLPNDPKPWMLAYAEITAYAMNHVDEETVEIHAKYRGGVDNGKLFETEDTETFTWKIR